jgi:hypothetical protein
MTHSQSNHVLYKAGKCYSNLYIQVPYNLSWSNYYADLKILKTVSNKIYNINILKLPSCALT